MIFICSINFGTNQIKKSEEEGTHSRLLAGRVSSYFLYSEML